MKETLVSVVMPCYNAERFLRPAVDSMLNQTHKSLEVILINDGSTDSTGDILEDYAQKDSRINVLHNDSNNGVIFSLNRGVAKASGDFIARMDADDVCLPQRFRLQVEYFYRFPETDLLCTDCSLIGMNGQFLANPIPYHFTDKTIQFYLFLLNPIIHPSVMGRSTLLKQYAYSSEAKHSEDFELWSRLHYNSKIIRNLPQRLLLFRRNITSVSHRAEKQQINTFLNTTKRNISNYFQIDTPEQVHKALVNRMTYGTVRLSDVTQALEILSNMFQTYIVKERLGTNEINNLKRLISRHKFNILIQSNLRAHPDEKSKLIRYTLPKLAASIFTKVGSNSFRKKLLEKWRS